MGSTAKERLCKQPTEKIKYAMEFAARLATGETINSVDSVTSVLIDGSTSDLTITDTAIENDGTQVTMWIEDGTATKQYRVEVLVTTTSSQTLEGDGILKVSDR